MISIIEYHKGNATVEFLVIAGVLVPAFLAMPMLGKLADAKHATVQANRYAVWEKTVGGGEQKSDEQLSEEVAARFLSDPNATILTEGQEEMDANPFWTPIGGDEENALIGKGNTAVRSVNHDVPNGVGGEYINSAMIAIGDAMEGPISNAKWDVQSKGFYTVSLQTEIAANDLVKDGVNCLGEQSEEVATCLNVVGAIFTGEWDAQSNDQVESRVRSMVPAGALNDVMNVVSLIGVIPLFKELKHLKDAFGTVSPDVLPEDRYGEL